MSNAIEIEAKVLVSQDDYKKLAKAFKAHTRYTQTNYYIDDDQLELGKGGIALRIREKDDAYTLTLKTPLSQGLLEKNEPLTKKQFEDFRDRGEFPKTDLVRFLTMLGFDVDKLKIITYLTTDRIDVEIGDGLLSIDRNVYSGKTDYEIEFEYNNMDGATDILEKILSEYDVPFKINKATKVQRALKAASEA
ncbi:MAG: CYTH domain-containing protein [Bacillota bacterium]|nr:CYTH domain-containing protein [Bacillota bacterium]